MFAFFAHSRYMPCPDCGVSLTGEERSEHRCDRDHRLDFQMFQLHSQIASFEEELADYLRSPEGKFDAWYAEHRRAA
jgi:hypothetical protein